tara:strand:+ start:18692 stop:20716 length:2025 start_codon:yes stop_codon:yes gene_type:complete
MAGAAKKRDLASLLGQAGGGRKGKSGGKPGGSILAQAAAVSGKRAKTSDGTNGNTDGKAKAIDTTGAEVSKPRVDAAGPRRDQPSSKKQTSRWDAPDAEAAKPKGNSRWDEEEEEEEEAPEEEANVSEKKPPESYMDKMVREAMEFKMANEVDEIGAETDPKTKKKSTGVNVAAIMAMRTPSSDGDATPREDQLDVEPEDAELRKAEEACRLEREASAAAYASSGRKQIDDINAELGERDDAINVYDALKDVDDLDADDGAAKGVDEAHIGDVQGPKRGPPRLDNSPNNCRPSKSLSPERAEIPDDENNSPTSSGRGKQSRSLSPSSPSAHKERVFDATATCRSVFQFEQLNRIDEGTYGVVFRARDKQSGEIKALKKVKMEKEKEGFPMTALREANILLSMSHPNVVDVSEMVVGNSLDSVFMVMEFCEHDLKGLIELQRKPFSVSEVKCFMRQLIEGVGYMHDNWTLHRDLKTSNILVNNKGQLKICDFGLARHYGDPLGAYTAMVVTLWYRAPELLLGQTIYGPAIDVWSLGCIFGELLQLKPLFTGKSEIDQINKISNILGVPNENVWSGFSRLPGVGKVKFPHQPYSHLRNVFPDHDNTNTDGVMTHLSDSGFDLINRALAYDPGRRLSTGEALKHKWFAEFPPAKQQRLMPTFPSRAAGRDVPKYKVL